MNKPLVYNYRKAEDRITELEGIVIRQNLQIEHLERRHKVHKPIKLDGKYECPSCYWIFCKDEASKELIVKEHLYNYCPYCGQHIKWR